MGWNRKALWAAGLALAGTAANLIPTELPGHLLILPGALFYLPAVLAMPAAGAWVVAAGPLLATLWLGHPFVLMVGMAEVGWQLAWRRWVRRSPVLAEATYWPLIGWPLIYALYAGVAAVPVAVVAAVMVRTAAIHLLAAAAGSFLLERTVLGEGGGRRVRKVREVVLQTLAVLVSLPLGVLVLGAAVVAGERLKEENQTVLTAAARRVARQMGLFLEHHEATVSAAAAAIGRAPAAAPVILQECHRAHGEFVTMLVADAEGRILLAEPAAALAQVKGHSVIDREYFREARERGKPFVSGVFRGRGFGQDLIVAIAAPIRGPDGEFAGVVQAALKVEEFARSLSGPESGRSGQFDTGLVLVDRSGRTIYADSGAGPGTLERIEFSPLHRAAAVADEERIEFVRERDGRREPMVAVAVRDERSGALVVAHRPLLAGLESPWRLGLVVIAAGLTLAGAAIWTGRIARGTVAAPLEAFVDRAARRGESTPVEAMPPPPQDAADEVAAVYRAFDGMAERLNRTYQQLLRHNEELDGKVVERTRDLEAARRAAEAASRSKSEFLAMTSHEIRTPLNAIIGLASTLAAQEHRPEVRPRLETIRNSGIRLLAVVNDLLDLSRAEAGKLELAPAPADLRALLGDVEQLFRLSAQHQGLELRVESPEDVGWLELDALRLQQVLINLVGNALKFTRSGRVTVRLRTESEGDTVRLRWEVEDTGPGIAPEDFPRLFLPYEQLPGPARREAGTGLGLPISQRLVALFGGTLEVESELGKGSIFRFEFEARRAKAPVQVSGGANRPRRILVVDDNPVNQEVLRAMLEGHGVELEAVDSVAAAKDRMEAGNYDLALIDLQLEDGMGYDVARAVRARQVRDGSACRLVAVSAHRRDDVWAECQASGFDGFMSKPVDRRELAGWLGVEPSGS